MDLPQPPFHVQRGGRPSRPIPATVAGFIDSKWLRRKIAAAFPYRLAVTSHDRSVVNAATFDYVSR